MELFKEAKAVRLRSHHKKYLYAEQDEESVCQSRDGASKNARWTIEFVEHSNRLIRLKSCYGRYLMASDKPFPLTGGRVLQTPPGRLDSSVEWEPIKEEPRLKLKTRYDDYLRANGGLPPWRNTITHDIPNRTVTQDWVLWEIDVVEIQMPPSPLSSSHFSGYLHTKTSDKSSLDGEEVEEWESHDFGGSHDIKSFKRTESDLQHPPSLKESPSLKANGRFIYYAFGDEDGDVDDTTKWPSFMFSGTNLKELKLKVEEETGLDDFTLCSRNPVNGRLCTLRLQLPPNNAAMRVVLINSSSRLAKELSHWGRG